MKIAAIIESLPAQSKKEYTDLLDRDANFTGPALELWAREPVLQKAWPRKKTFTSALSIYRSKYLGKRVK